MNPAFTQLKELAEMGMTQVASKKELEAFFKMIVRMLKQVEAKRTKEYEALVALFQRINTELGAKGESALSLQKETRKLLEEVRETIPTVPDITPLETRLNELQLLSMEEVSDCMPMLGEQVRDALELLPKGEKLNIDAIEDLREELDKVRQIQLTKKDNVVYVGSGGGGGGHIVKSYDLSGSLDGSTQTFSLPAFWRVISVHLSSVPNILRPTTDYTTDGSAFTITFTSEINAATSLASGQTCLIVYSE